MVLIDSNIIIYLSRGDITVEQLLFTEDIFAISVVSYMEVLGYNFKSNDEENFVKDLLNCFEIIYIDYEIAHKVIELRKKYTIKLPDAIICASAIVNDAILVTNDTEMNIIKELKLYSIK